MFWNFVLPMRLEFKVESPTKVSERFTEVPWACKFVFMNNNNNNNYICFLLCQTITEDVHMYEILLLSDLPKYERAIHLYCLRVVGMFFSFSYEIVY